MRTNIYIIITTIIFASCGGQKQEVDSTQQSDTLVMPEETLTAFRTTQSDDTQKPAHNADNFFAIEADGKIMVGNSADILKTTDIKGTDITLAPTGDIIAYTDTTDGRCTVHLYNINTKNDRSLDLGIYNYHSRSFSPDGNLLAVSCQFDEYSCMVRLYNMRDSSLTSIVNPDTKALYNPIFSPDGRLLSCHDMQKVLVYTLANGIAKHIKTISCDHLCVDNGLSINTSCKIQFTPGNDRIVYTCADYDSERDDLRHLNIYNITNGDILKILPSDKSCKDFAVSDDGNIYFLMEADSSHAVAYFASLSDLSPVAISKDKFNNATALRVAY
jgi:hypothetical protein